MKHEVISLHTLFEGLGKATGDAFLTTYILENSPEIEAERVRPAIVICPGGGYGFISAREAEAVALKFVAEGYSAFVLTYSIAPSRYPQQLLELSASIAHIRRNAEAWHIDTDKIITCGFSAGGHLAGSLGTLWYKDFILETLGITYGENKPNGMILSYPVITSGEHSHGGSFTNLLGEAATDQEKECLSLEKLVDELTPPTFLWHTFADTCVPVENSLLFATALRKYHIPFELHIYPEGCHGLSLCSQLVASPSRPELINPHAATWFKLALEWIEKSI